MIDGVTNPAYASAQCAARGTTAAGEKARPQEETPDRPDAVELSPAAREQLGPADSEEIRAELVERVRAQIAAGEYLTDDKIDAAIERLHDEISAVA